jgi:hypothetical protein
LIILIAGKCTKQVEPSSLSCPQHQRQPQVQVLVNEAMRNRKLEVDVVGEACAPRFGERHRSLAF